MIQSDSFILIHFSDYFGFCFSRMHLDLKMFSHLHWKTKQNIEEEQQFLKFDEKYSKKKKSVL